MGAALMQPRWGWETILRQGTQGSSCLATLGWRTPSLWDCTPAALAAETLKLERALSDLVNQAYGLTPAEIDLMWKTAPPRMPIPPPAT